MSRRRAPKTQTQSRQTHARPKKSPTMKQPIEPPYDPKKPLTLSEDFLAENIGEGDPMDGHEGSPAQPEPATAAAPLPRIEVQPMFEQVDPAAQPEGATQIAPVYYTKDEFYEFFGGMFQFAGMGVALVPPLNRPMQSLITARQLPSSRPASDAIYDLAQKHEWLRWLIDKTSDDLKAFMFIGLFALGVGIGVKEELRQRANLIAKLEQEYERAQSDEKNPRTRQPEGNA